MNKFMISWASIKEQKYQENLVRMLAYGYAGFVVFCYIYTFATAL